MIKKRVSLILSIAMVMALLVPTFALGSQKDYENNWAEETIQKWFDNKMILGYEDGSFKPDNSISRVEFMTMVNNSYDFEDKAEISFDDVDTEEWYYPQVQKAVQAGYIIGDGDNTIRPSDEISREEVAVIITRLNNLDKTSENIETFVDAEDISDWAVEFVGAVLAAEYMIGNDKGEFNPTDSITRAESLVTLDRAMKDKDQTDEEIKYANLVDLIIKGAELEQEFTAEKTTYSAISAADVEFIEITAVATTGSAVTITASSIGGSEVEVTTSSAIDGNVEYTANIPLAKAGDTLVTITVSAPNHEDKIYKIVIK